MKNRLVALLGLALLVLLGVSSGAHAADKVKAVASFSILGDMVRQVGGDRVDVVTLVGPDGDAHVFSPTPADAKTLASSQLFFVNGLGFEGWMERLEKSSGFKGKTIVASHGVKPHTMVEEEGGEAETITDPHAWQDLANGKLYVANIRDGLIAADPDGKAIYEANAAKYLDAIATEEDGGEGRRSAAAARSAAQDHHQPRRVRLFRRGLRARDHRARGRQHRERGLAPRTWPRSSARSRPSTSRRCSSRTSPTIACSTRSRARPAPRSAARSIPTRCRGLTGRRRIISTCSATMSARSPRRCRVDDFEVDRGRRRGAAGGDRRRHAGAGGWQIRLGLHWLVEHFLAYFAVTAIFCLAWPRPMAVAAVLLPVAVLLETAQGLTPDRTADPATALSAATGVAVAALLADLVLALGKRRKA